MDSSPYTQPPPDYSPEGSPLPTSSQAQSAQPPPTAYQEALLAEEYRMKQRGYDEHVPYPVSHASK